MKRLLVALLLSSCAWAATVQGVVFDEETQSPLARTRVTLTPLPGNPAAAASLLSNEKGQYVFSDVHPGWYLLRAMRIGYAVAEFGQSRPGLPGPPFQVVDGPDSAESRQIVMRRQAAITGSVVDDNSIGIAGWAVNLYSARQPIRRITQGMTDDRGNFRLGELDPGSYIVRSGGGGLEDASTLVPTYFKYGTTVAGAEPVRVRLGETQAFVVIHTVEGKLFDLTGEVTAPEKRGIRLTLITDTGRRIIGNTAGPFAASGVPPGLVELLVEGSSCAGYQQILVDRNMFARVDCTALAPPVVSGALDYSVIARRLDLDGPGPEGPLSPGQPIAPGHWEFTVRAAPSHYLVSIQNDGDNSIHSAIDGWFGLNIGNAPHLLVTLSAKPASISGVVSSSSRSVIGAPVFLDLLNPDAPDLSLQSWTGRTDAQGNFAFNGLAPGSYRVMSSFDVDSDDPLAKNKSVTVNLREGDAVTQPLDMILQ